MLIDFMTIVMSNLEKRAINDLIMIYNEMA